MKCVYFETQDSDWEAKEMKGQGLAAMRDFVKSNFKYGSSGSRDARLEINRQHLGGHMGTLHFIKFATSRMDGFFDMVTKNGLGRFAKIVCATGGGAFKFETDFKEVSTMGMVARVQFHGKLTNSTNLVHLFTFLEY